uniref:Uncharacterized protein LOC105048628 isoform X2 n=1 Tax=Elaeis guineensis var. tenera TaxID=51953 RepID=A0A6J0PKC8_ELAGV|nr:uncharacterized protein LOC105048628 isoform X2 [Elaeis guineensis]
MSPFADVGGNDLRGGLSPDNASSAPPAAPRPIRAVLNPITDEEWRRFLRCVEAAGKGFTIGAGLKGGLALFSILVRLRSRRTVGTSSRKVGVITNEDAVAEAVKETLRYGLFLGSFAGTFVSVDECIAAIGGNKRTAGWRALVAGLFAGPSMLLTGPNTQHTSLAIYILMRASVLASRWGLKSKRFRNVCKPLTWSHGDIFLMCLSSSQIFFSKADVSASSLGDKYQRTMLSAYLGQDGRSAYILKQDSLPSSYKSFLNKHGGKNAVILQGVKDIACNIPFTNLEAIEKYYKSLGVDIKLDPHMKVPCSIIHGNQSCVGHFISFLLQAYKRALPVYLPVYLVPALIVHRQGLMKRAWTCLLFRIFKRCNTPMVAMGTFPSGLALLIEKKSRRIEISLYCLARAIESFFACMAEAGLCPPASKLKRADVAVFSVATAIIMHCYAREREVFRSKYLNVLDWVFGVPPASDDEHDEKC